MAHRSTPLCARSTARALLLLSLADIAVGWATRSQTVYGAQISEIKDLMNGLAVDRTEQAQLGYLWSMPQDVHDTHGLGGGITWAFNPALCDLLGAPGLFREEVPGANLVNCDSYRSAVARAFDNWSANNRYVKFQDVTEECEAADQNYGPPTRESQPGMPHGGCPLAEIWVTQYSSSRRRMYASEVEAFNETLDDTDVMEELSSGVAVATATAHAQYTSNFYYTSGQRPFYADRTGDARYNRRVVETYAGTFTFNTDPSQVCWYMDSSFCSGFHDLKATFGGANNAKMFVQALTFGLMAIGIVFYAVFFFHFIYRVAYPSEEDDINNDGELDTWERVQAGLRTTLRWNPLVITFFVCLLYMPAILYTRIFAPCFECYDFEAAALHEIGHFLGLGHLDNIPANWLAPASDGGVGSYAWAGPNPGQNSYQADIAAGVDAGQRPAYNCTHPWGAVGAGVPPGIPESKLDTSNPDRTYDYRNAQMEARTQHNPSSCLFDDDLEALATLYPDCGDFALTSAVCHQNAWNLGYVRIAAYVLFPMVITLLGVILFVSVLHKLQKDDNKRLGKFGLKLTGAMSELDKQLKVEQAKHKRRSSLKGVTKRPSTRGMPVVVSQIEPSVEQIN